MQSLPNLAHSKQVEKLCRKLRVADPFRVLNPNLIDFSFAPWGNVRKNRSRIDFLISKSICKFVETCKINPSVQSKLFDHKAIILDFNKRKPVSSRPNISSKILKDPDVDYVVRLASYECYVLNSVNDALTNRLLNTPFNNTHEQREFIYNHFASSFKKNPLELESLDGCIENFLGAEILNHPIVTNLKLSENECLRLDSPITEFELEIALEGANSKSAAGIDGINTAFIKRYWYIFKTPLSRYASKAFEKGTLTHSFKTAIIKRKKGMEGTLRNGDQFLFSLVCIKSTCMSYRLWMFSFLPYESRLYWCPYFCSVSSSYGT
jgi:hypothetical protein